MEIQFYLHTFVLEDKQALDLVWKGKTFLGA